MPDMMNDTGKRHRLLMLVIAASALAAQTARADVITDWNQTAIAANAAGGANGPAQSRNLALVHAAMFDAVNAVDHRHAVYAVEVKGKPGASMEAAAAAAAYGVLARLYWFQTPVFDVALDASLAAIPDGPARADGMAIGRDVAEKFMALRSNDGSSASVTYTPRAARASIN